MTEKQIDTLKEINLSYTRSLISGSPLTIFGELDVESILVGLSSEDKTGLVRIYNIHNRNEAIKRKPILEQAVTDNDSLIATPI